MNNTALKYGNVQRSEDGCRRQVAEARKALQLLKKFDGHSGMRRFPGRHERCVRALLVRIANPHSTLEQLAAAQDMTKNAYWSQLRRAFEYAAWFERHA